ncbi:hypothetical protein N7481_012421 [Penicillium waksmanii]|uniref:uncharacterized protein n=1 Tax=Penicillium waksmanii TaxID=69791 RepID=UPI0025496AE5|nr:uncharacterized protein N7481_012421 [Penicillium waksmanii]KAJ5965707.1 hypothetical protein N7481_012421 [Penicillium waksmanii]
MDGAAKMPANPCFPAPIKTHIRNQDSYSSSLSHDAMALGEPIPSPRRCFTITATILHGSRTSHDVSVSLSAEDEGTLSAHATQITGIGILPRINIMRRCASIRSKDSSAIKAAGRPFIENVEI